MRAHKTTTLLSFIFLSTKARAAISSGAPGTGCDRYCDGCGSGGVVFTCAHPAHCLNPCVLWPSISPYRDEHNQLLFTWSPLVLELFLEQQWPIC